MNTPPVLFWFRQDLRLRDNPALQAAAELSAASNAPLIPLFILDDESAGPWKHGSASRWWLHHSLKSLSNSLNRHGFDLVLRRGRAGRVLKDLIEETGANALFWNRCYEPWRMARDEHIETHFRSMGLRAESFKSGLLFDPPEIRTKTGGPFRVFTPFYRACLAAPPPRVPLPTLPKDAKPKGGTAQSLSLDELCLLPRIRWDEQFPEHWTPGEAGAQARLESFLSGAPDYGAMRDRPDRDGTSRLSPHLHWGEISPFQVWHAVGDRSDSFLRELIWREFTHHLLFHNRFMPEEPLQPKFKAFPWKEDASALERWQKGLTGIPIVDAGMRQLWATGWMHNRVRMIAGSFLVKNLRLHWHHGQAWFWDCLVDADLANNSGGWQWIAGCGADAAPYFRIFNPVLQGEKFDPDGEYVRLWVPELGDMPAKYIHNPWAAPEKFRPPAAAYPAPIVDLASSRMKALECYKAACS